MGSTENYTLALVKNATPQAPTIGAALANGVKSPIPLQSIVSLTDGDTLKVQIKGDSTSDDLIVTDLALRVVEIRT